ALAIASRGGRSCRVVCSVLAALGIGIGVVLVPSASLLGQTISEIHYHPRSDEESLEFIEIANDLTIPVDLSGYSFTTGIQFVFPQGTILLPDEFIVVCADVDAVKARYGIDNAIGNYTGRLDGSGERITLANHVGVVLAEVRYRVGGKWPVAPYGTGHTLSLRNVHLDPGEPESWTSSVELGGTPGRLNFATGGAPQYEEISLVGSDEPWRFRKGIEAYSEPFDAWVDP